jgi:hypothetical protein
MIRCRTPTRSSSAIVSSTRSVGSGGARRTGRSLLRDLKPGSLILFGSFKAAEFVLDTVFVTDEGIQHDHDSWPRVLTDLPETYADVTMLATYAWGPGAELRFYSGATPRRPTNGHVQRPADQHNHPCHRKETTRASETRPPGATAGPRGTTEPLKGPAAAASGHQPKITKD